MASSGNDTHSAKARLPFGERLIKSMENGLAALKENRPLPYTIVPLAPDEAQPEAQTEKPDRKD